MPWLQTPLTWDSSTGRLLEVDREDAERLADTSGADFRVMKFLEPENEEYEYPIPGAPFDEPLTEYVCDICGVSYKHRTSLIRHKKVKHGNDNRK